MAVVIQLTPRQSEVIKDTMKEAIDDREVILDSSGRTAGFQMDNPREYLGVIIRNNRPSRRVLLAILRKINIEEGSE